jgi:hypothetical protein
MSSLSLILKDNISKERNPWYDILGPGMPISQDGRIFACGGNYSLVDLH